ncbi:Dysferlin-like protein, partial [Globisporangium splendens]
MGLKKKTSTKYETLGCVFDEILFFHFTNIGRNELKQATIKRHRSRDVLHVHDRDAEIAKELTMSTASLQGATPSGAISADPSHSVVLMPPTIDLKLHFLLVKVFKTEDLPAMDEGGLVLSSGIDAFVQIGFASNSTCKSSVVTVKGTSNLSPEFLEELWIPVLAPTLSRNIIISVWDRDLGRKDEVVGISLRDYQQVPSSTCPGRILSTATDTRGKTSLSEREEGMFMGTEGAQEQETVEPRWFDLYGPPLRRINKKRAMVICQNPELGSTYRGRALLSMEKVESPMLSESEKFHTKRMRDALSADTGDSRFSKTIKYVLRCALFCGADIPQFHSIVSTKTKMRVTVSIGSYEIHFDSQPVRKDGRVDWERCKERWPIISPADLTQLPDLIITLSCQLEKDDFVGVSFIRAPAADFFVKGFNAKTEWIHLKEDISRRQTKYALDKTQSPGSLLIRVGFGREEIAVCCPWGDEMELFAPFRNLTVHREIRVHIFQFRKLVIPEGKTRLPNPFVSVTCCGQTKKTAPKYKTLDPLFYESLVFLAHVPADVVFTPDLVFRIHDANVSTSTEVPAGIFGELTVSMNKAVKSVANASVPRPSWYQLQMRNPNFSSPLIEEIKGEALISIQFVDHPGSIEHFQRLDPLTPAYEDATLEIVALGVRKLKALSALGVQRPHMEFELIGGMFSDGTNVRKSKPSASGNAKNANFLDRLVCPAKLPVDTLFAPQLRIKVCESSLGGLRKATIASCIVDLSTKLPWSIEYVPPQQQQAFENPMAAPAFTTEDKEKQKHKVRFSMLKVSKQRKATGIQDAGTLVDPDDLLSGDDDEDDGNEKEEQLQDDGIGIGSLELPEISLSKPSRSQISDPALLNQLQSEEQRRYLAGRADTLRGGAQGRGGGGENTLHDNNADSDTVHRQAPYLAGRDWWITDHSGEELEHFLKVKALEIYPFYRSVLARPSLLKRKRVRAELKAGLFKGLISITERKKKLTKAHNLSDVERLQEPQSLVVRVYVLRGSNLQSKDSNGYSDPYLRLKLGKSIISDRVNHKKKTLNPDFFRMFSFNTTLPGPSQLEIGRAENITDKDNSEINDYFVKAWMEGGKADSTDVHWRCSSGKPCWNYRFKFPVEYPLRTPEFGRLHIQLWDKDVLKWNDILGEAQLDLYKWIRRAYENNRIASPFLELKAMAKATTVESGSVEDTAAGGDAENQSSDADDGEDEGDEDDDDDDEVDTDFAGGSAKENHSLLRNQKQKKRKLKKPKGKFKKPAFLKKPPADTVKQARKAKEEAEAKAALNGLLGRIGISVQIVPELEAQMDPVGKGQEAPNMNPYLPPPVGRMRLSANPIMMLKELVGPKMCLRVTILYCCVGCAFFIGVFGATIMSTLTYFQGMSRGDTNSEQAPWHLPDNFRYPHDFQDPQNASAIAGGGT